MSERRFSVSDFANNADRFDAYEAECDRLEQQLTAERDTNEINRRAIDHWKQRAESAEQRNREAMEQEPIGEKSLNGIEWEHALTVDLMEVGTKLYAAPIPPADVAELQRKLHQSDLNFDALEKQNAELTRKLAEQQAKITQVREICAGEAAPRWDNSPQTSYTRGLILDLTEGGTEQLTKFLEEARKQEREEILNEHEWFSREGKWLADSIRARGGRA